MRHAVLGHRITAARAGMALRTFGPSDQGGLHLTMAEQQRKEVETMRAKVGDGLTIKGRHQGDEDRHGEIIEIHGKDGAPPYLVRWRDAHESLFFPSSDTVVEHHPADVPGR
jgi:hypothetical protein